MPPPRDWPTKADQIRMDGVALFLDVQHYSVSIQAAVINGDLEEAMRISALNYHAGVKGQKLLNEARKGES